MLTINGVEIQATEKEDRCNKVIALLEKNEKNQSQQKICPLIQANNSNTDFEKTIKDKYSIKDSDGRIFAVTDYGHFSNKRYTLQFKCYKNIHKNIHSYNFYYYFNDVINKTLNDKDINIISFVIIITFLWSESLLVYKQYIRDTKIFR